MRSILLDAGPQIALFAVDDKHHARYDKLIAELSVNGLRLLTDIIRWMENYTEPGKREMDFADASLYWLALETGMREIVTVDVRDFSRYRLPDGQAFSIL